jgi:Spy/CpxP family protein refolding chaperone
MKKLYTYTALALIVILGSYQMVMARPGQEKGGDKPGNNNRPPISFVQALQLTDDQVGLITVLIKNNNTACTILEDKMQANKDSMQLLEWSKDFSPEKVEALMKDTRDTMTKLQLNHEKLMVDIKLLLTTEQLQKFNQIMEGPKEGPGQGRQVPMLFGKMSNINLADKTFTFLAKDPQGNEISFKVTYFDRTKFARDKQPAKPEDFKDGEEITIAGNINPEAKTIDAMMIVLGKMDPPRNPGKGPGQG